MPKILREYNYLGIDPGKSNGGLAALDRTAGVMDAIKIPATERDTWEWFEGWGMGTFAYVEWIHPAIRGAGKSSMSKLYGSYMALRMALTAAGIPFEDVKPYVWQKGLGIPQRKKKETDTQWKNRLKAKAQQLFPSVTVMLATADALLIAEFCRRKHEGKL